MRKLLRHWFRPTEDEERELWAKGIFSFDASVLLNIYGYSRETRDELVKLIKVNSDRIRLPHQFGLEYARNRSVVIMRQVSNYAKAEEALQQFRENLIDPKREHPYLTKQSLENLTAITAELACGKREIEKLLKCDPYAEVVLSVFEGKLGPAPSPENLAKLHDEAKDRYDKKCPPGYADLGEKGIPDAYGDYVGWSQLIEIARTEKKDVVFVTDDFKEDWWRIVRGQKRDRTVGPRPELIEELARLAEQQLWVYTSEEFLRAAKKFANAQIHDNVIEEIRQRLASQRESERIPDLKSTSSGSLLAKSEEEGSDAKKSSYEELPKEVESLPNPSSATVVAPHFQEKSEALTDEEKA